MTDELTRLKAAAIVKRLYSMAQNDDEMVTIWKEAAELILSLITRLERARNEALEEAAHSCDNCSWGADIEWWLNATKKDISAKSCIECGVAIRNLKSTPTNGL